MQINVSNGISKKNPYEFYWTSPVSAHKLHGTNKTPLVPGASQQEPNIPECVQQAGLHPASHSMSGRRAGLRARTYVGRGRRQLISC